MCAPNEYVLTFRFSWACICVRAHKPLTVVRWCRGKASGDVQNDTTLKDLELRKKLVRNALVYYD